MRERGVRTYGKVRHPKSTLQLDVETDITDGIVECCEAAKYS